MSAFILTKVFNIFGNILFLWMVHVKMKEILFRFFVFPLIFYIIFGTVFFNGCYFVNTPEMLNYSCYVTENLLATQVTFEGNNFNEVITSTRI